MIEGKVNTNILLIVFFSFSELCLPGVLVILVPTTDKWASTTIFWFDWAVFCLYVAIIIIVSHIFFFFAQLFSVREHKLNEIGWRILDCCLDLVTIRIFYRVEYVLFRRGCIIIVWCGIGLRAAAKLIPLIYVISAKRFPRNAHWDHCLLCDIFNFCVCGHSPRHCIKAFAALDNFYIVGTRTSAWSFLKWSATLFSLIEMKMNSLNASSSQCEFLFGSPLTFLIIALQCVVPAYEIHFAFTDSRLSMKCHFIHYCN